MKKTIFILLLNAFWISLQGQSNISGKVLTENETALGYASVLLMNATDSTFIRGTISDENGNYLFQKIENGTYFLNISMLGYQSQNTAHFDVKGIDLTFNTILIENSEVLDEVTITAQKPLFEQQIDRTVVNVQSSIAAKGSNALEIIARSPGVEIDRINNEISMFGKGDVIVMLNGKRMRMSGDGLLQLLQGMPTSNIEKIELITTPPASFDAEGNAGFINIVTVQHENEGINGSLSLNAGYGVRHKLGGSSNLNIRKNKLNIFIDLSASYDDTQQNTTFYRSNNYEGQITSFDIFGNRPAIIELYSGRLGLDYNITDRTVIGVLTSAYLSKWTMNSLTTTQVEDNINGSSSVLLNANEINDWTHWMGNINLRHTFLNDDKLSFDLDYLSYYDNNPTEYVDQFFDRDDNLVATNEFSSYKRTPIHFLVFKTDYQKKISEAVQIEMGIKGTRSQFINDVGVERLTNGEWLADDRFTDIFEMNEQIGAIYFSGDYKINDKISTKAGLRYEYYDSQIESEGNTNPIVSFQFGRLFPTAYLSYTINENQQLQFSYNERITRPQMNHLAPAFFFWDNTTILAGNPGVKPTITKSGTLTYRHKTTLLTANFTDFDNPFTFQPFVDAEENITYSRATNMIDRKRAMLAINQPLEITDWWESRYSLSGFWMFTSPIFDEVIYEQHTYYFLARMTQNFKLKNDFGIELSGSYRNAFAWSLATIPQRYRLNMGIQKKFNNDMQLSLTWNDMFNFGSFFETYYNRPDLNLVFLFHYDMEGNIFRLNFSWNFGNSKLKKGGNRQTGSSEERQRVN